MPTIQLAVLKGEGACSGHKVQLVALEHRIQTWGTWGSGCFEQRRGKDVHGR